jgi:cyclophilin family peptidyl-prolyl cis-trans isomerase
VRLRACLSKQYGLIAAALLAAAALVGCGTNNNSSGNSAKGQGTPSARATAGPGGAGRTFAKAPAFTIDPDKGYIATIKTDKGDIVVQLNANAAPYTVNNFVFLARQHFYDGLTCHHVVQNFLAQCGDPLGNDTGNAGYTIPDEKSPLEHTAGAVAMARGSSPNSAGSQFYILLSPHPELNGQDTVFGQVISGLDVAQSFTPRDPSQPNAPAGDRIIGITIEETNATPTPFVPQQSTPGASASGTPAR